MQVVQLAQGVEFLALAVRRHLVVLQVADRVLQVGDERALVRRGQERGAVLAAAFDQRAGADGDEAGQVLVLGAEAVCHPRTEARPRGDPLAGVHLQAAAGVVDVVGDHRAEDAQLIDARPTCGNSSLTSRPDSPYFWNFQGEASRFRFWPR